MINNGCIDMGDGRLIQSLHSQMYYNRAFNRDATDKEIYLIKRHISETKIVPESKQIIHSVYLLENDGNDSYEDFEMEIYIELQRVHNPEYYDYLNSLAALGTNSNEFA